MFDGETDFQYNEHLMYDRFRSKHDLHRKVRNWFDGLDRETRDADLPVFVPGETYSPDADN